METNETIQSILPNNEPKRADGVPISKLSPHSGRPKGTISANSKNPSSIAKAFKRAGLDWKEAFALDIKANKRERIQMWLRLLPYLVTTTNRVHVKRWKGKASRAAIIALNALEGRNEA